MTLFSRSCVIGRCGVTFSICSAIAFASNTPTQIGSTRLPSLSRRITIGMFVIGSTISPLIVISICMVHHLTAETVWVRRGDSHRKRLADPGRVAREVDDSIAGRAPGEFPFPPAAAGVDQHLLDPPDSGVVQ